MWFFKAPHIIFGEEALSHLEQVGGTRAFIVTDAVMEKLGFVDKVQEHLKAAGIVSAVFSDVEPNPSLETVHRCAAAMNEYEPDLIIGMGGGSCMDAAKAAWFRYERPDVELEAVNVMETFGLRSKARLVTIPTTAGSGSEVSQAALITDLEARRKLEIASYEFIADVTIVDPLFSARMPQQLTADSGIDVLTHAVEAYNNNMTNDFTDGLCLQAARLVFEYLPRAVACGEQDLVAREKMANAATIAGLGIGNSMIALAHAMGHSAGAIFNLTHGRVTGLLLPYTVEYTANGGAGRYRDMAQFLGLCADDELKAAYNLAAAIRALMSKIGQPLSLKEAGLLREVFDRELEAVCDRTEMDLGLVMAKRIPDRQELERLFEYAYEGKVVDF